MNGITAKALLLLIIGVFGGSLHSLAVQDVEKFASGVHEIDLAEAKRLFDGQGAVFLDARAAWPFKVSHIPGAINIPPDDISTALDAKLADLPRDAVLAVYCSGTTCSLGADLARLLVEEKGFARVYVFDGGFPQWEQAGYPVDSEVSSQ